MKSRKEKSKKQKKSAAIVTLHDIANMSDKGRKQIVKWLHQQASYVASKRTAKTFAKRYTARYLYV